jgi:lysophospholipase L1-like esterase
VTIGDSFTFGIYVDTKENYPERLEDILNDNSLCKTSKKFEVINLGVWGYDIEYSVHRFKMRGQKYNPDLVLWYLVGNDFSVINEIVSPKAIQYRKEMLADKALLSKFYGKGEFYPWWEKAIQELAEEVNRLGGLEYQKTALDRLNDYYKGKLVLGTFSSLKNLYVQALRDFAKVRSGTYIFDGLTSDYDQFADRHPASKGYEQIASGVFDYINSNHLIPCD